MTTTRCDQCAAGDCQRCPRPDRRGRLAADDKRCPTCCCGRRFRTDVIELADYAEALGGVVAT